MSQPQLFTRDQTLPNVFRYSVFRKAGMAISGIALVLFVYGHWYGNQVLLDGEIAFNNYHQWLQNHPVLHYCVWLFFLTPLLIHLAIGPAHWFLNRRKRTVAYRKKRYQATTLAARFMMLSGTCLLLFLIIHIAQVRGWLVFAEGGIYRNLQAGFANWYMIAIYLLGQLAIAFHLYHGLWSTFQTLGINHRLINPFRRPVAIVIGIGIAILNCYLIILNVDFAKLLPGIAS